MNYALISLWCALAVIVAVYFYTGGKDTGWVGSMIFTAGVITVITVWEN